MAITLYHVSWCPECALVREKLEELHIPYEDVVVPDFRPFRKQVFEVSGQYFVPVLKDGDTVLTEAGEILAYLEEQYGETSAKGERGGTGKRGETGQMGEACRIGEKGEKSETG
jgi:mycoredoxin